MCFYAVGGTGYALYMSPVSYKDKDMDFWDGSA